MKAFIVLMAALVVGNNFAKADGFVCADQSKTYGIKLYDHVHANLGTRTPAVMVITNGSLDQGSKTLATFTAADGGLLLSGADYVANLNFSSAHTELFAGVQLNKIHRLILNVKHYFNVPLAEGQVVSAKLMVVETAKITYLDLSCQRYLKN